MRSYGRIAFTYIVLLLLFTACAPRIGNDGFRVVTKGTAYLENNKTRGEVTQEAVTDARERIGDYLRDYPETLRKYEGLLGRDIEDDLVIQSATHGAEIIKEKWGREARTDVRYAWAAIPIAAPNAYVSGGLSLLFPGLGRIYAKAGGYGQMLLGLVGAGTMIYTSLQYDDWNNRYIQENKIDLKLELYDTAKEWYTYTQASIAAYGILAVYSCIETYTRARSSQELLRILRQEGGIPTSNNSRFMIAPNYASRSLSFYFYF